MFKFYVKMAAVGEIKIWKEMVLELLPSLKARKIG